MNRQAEILKHVGRHQFGIEIGPWHSPLAPKADGFNCLSMDVFDTETLRKRARNDPAVPDELIGRIEDVDLVGGAGALGTLAAQHGLIGRIDYVISSHNIEHVPDPISFFQDCALVLKPGGYVSMAIPDRRACFDFFRPFTSLSQWIEANFSGRKHPTHAQVFELECLGADYDRSGIRSAGFHIENESPARLVPFNRLKNALALWRTRLAEQSDEYHDTHCWAFTPSSFELLMRDCRFLGLTAFDVVEVTPVNVHEFYVHLQLGKVHISSEDYLQNRFRLLHAVITESASNSLGQIRHSDYEKLLADVAHSNKELLDARSDSAQARAETAHAYEKLSEISAQLERHRVIAEALQARVNGLESSTSWRLTSPIRALRSLFR